MAFSDDRLKEIFVQVLGISPETYTSDLSIGEIDEWDSVAHFSLLSELEREFGCKFDMEEMVELTTVQAIRTRLGAAE